MLASITETVSPGPMPRAASADGQPAAALVELRVREALVAVDDGGVVGIDQRRALQELKGRQRLVVGGVLVEVLVVGIGGHVRPALEDGAAGEISAVSAKR